MNERPNTGEELAGIAGLALLLIMFLFAWYGFENAPDTVNGLDAFDAYDDWLNIILTFAAFAGISLALFGTGVARVPVSLSVIATILGALSSILLIIYLISPPDFGGAAGVGTEIDLERKLGVWLGLLSALALTLGGYLAMQEEGTSFGDAADRLSDRGQGAGAAPGTGAGPSPGTGTTTPPPPPPQQPPPPPPPGSGT